MNEITQLEERVRRTGETLLIKVRGTNTSLEFGRGRGRRREVLEGFDQSLNELLPLFVQRVEP